MNSKTWKRTTEILTHGGNAMRHGKRASGNRRCRRGQGNAGGFQRGRQERRMPSSGTGRGGSLLQRILNPVLHGPAVVNGSDAEAAINRDRLQGKGPVREQSDNSLNRTRGVKRMTVQVDASLCSGCGVCVDECPRGAIVVRDTASIDADLCTGCGVCVEACPVGALSLK